MSPPQEPPIPQSGTAADKLGALAKTVFKPASRREVTGAIEGAVAAGALTQAGPTLFIPVAAASPDSIPSSWRDWLARGYLPLRIQYCAHPPARVRTLGGILTALDSQSELNCVPQRLAGRWLASLHLPDARDLRDVLASGGYEDARRVHDYCLASLARFAAADAGLRASLRSAGLPPPSPFPVAKRYRWATERLTDLLGAVDLPSTLPGYAYHGPKVLFCDPKPANFLAPPGTWPGSNDSPAFPRIDLELMCYETPLALQIVLALFSQPVAFHQPGALVEQFAALTSYMGLAAADFGVQQAQLEPLLTYHIVRNFVSAATAPTRASAAKARSFARLLVCAIEELPYLRPTRRTRLLLRRWIDLADERFRRSRMTGPNHGL